MQKCKIQSKANTEIRSKRCNRPVWIGHTRHELWLGLYITDSVPNKICYTCECLKYTGNCNTRMIYQMKKKHFASVTCGKNQCISSTHLYTLSF